MLPAGGLQSILKSVHDYVEELLSILLLTSVSRLTIELLESEAETFRIVVAALRELQVSDELLQLVHHVVIDHFALVLLHLLLLAVVDAEQVVAESWHHEELLHHAVHVADATEVAQTDVFLGGIAG